MRRRRGLRRASGPALGTAPRQLRVAALPARDERWLHFLAILALAILCLVMSGCIEKWNGEPADYGTPDDPEKIMDAVVDMWRDAKFEATEVGAFVHYRTTQTLGGGSYASVISDTGHTITDKIEASDTLTYKMVEIKYTYRDKEADKLSREFELVYDRGGEQALATALHPTRETARAVIEDMVAKVRPQSEAKAPTYHKLRVWEEKAPPPEAARAAVCVPNVPCLITYRHVSFHIVYWDKPEGDRLIIDLVTSPDVSQTFGYNTSRVKSYIPGLMQSCLTQLVEIGETGSHTLLSECQQAVNYKLK